MNVLVSIITPCFNSAEYIAETIASVRCQTLSSWEMIIADDCSTDETTNIVISFAKHDSRIKMSRLSKNSGADVARNEAMKLAQGRYVAFLDSDDLWHPNKLAKQLKFMQTNNYVFTFTAYDRMDESGKVLTNVGAPSKVSYFDLLKNTIIGCSTVIYDRGYFGEVTMPAIRKRQDLGLWLKLLKVTDHAHGMSETLTRYRVRKNSVSSNKISAATYNWYLYRQIEGLSFVRSCYYFSNYAFNGLLRANLVPLAKLLRITT